MRRRRQPKVSGDGDQALVVVARKRAELKRRAQSQSDENDKEPVNLRSTVPNIIPEEIIKPRPKLIAIGWGWNSNGRSGNMTEREIRYPRQIQRSKELNFVNCAAGKHHSLVVAETGVIYSFGDGRYGQLGYGNQFNGSEVVKGGIVQPIARYVAPTGVLKYGHDIKFIEVGCGGTFSVARELSPSEGAEMVVGFAKSSGAILSLLKMYPESTSLRKAWAEIRQEQFDIDTNATGAVVSWGTGSKGQLGLGMHKSFSPSPYLVFSLRDTVITRISAGESHCLAIDNFGRLYSWGCGSNGKLGHGDFENRYSPEIIKYFMTLFVEQCSAGREHSVALTTTRAGIVPRLEQIRRVAAFGRGAHGRLGYGSNRNCPLPVLVSSFLPSLRGMQCLHITAGGAHTVMLMGRSVPVSLSNQYGAETCVVAWGYGRNGQLGDGLLQDSFIPVRCRTPRWEVFVEVSAGQ
jgi:alpha-tubulin suppressor-like RCC1 family protein